MKFDAFYGKSSVLLDCLNSVEHVYEAVKMKMYAF